MSYPGEHLKLTVSPVAGGVLPGSADFSNVLVRGQMLRRVMGYEIVQMSVKRSHNGLFRNLSN